MMLVEFITMTAWTVGIGYFWLGARLQEIANAGINVSRLPQWIQDEWGNKIISAASESRSTKLFKHWRWILAALYLLALVAALINSGEEFLFRFILDVLSLLIFVKWVRYLERIGN